MKKLIITVFAVCFSLFGCILEPQEVFAFKAVEAKVEKGKKVLPFKPKAEVKRREIKFERKKIETDEKGEAVFTAKIKNNGKGKLKKVVFYYRIFERQEKDAVVSDGSVSGTAVSKPESEGEESASIEGEESKESIENEESAASMGNGESVNVDEVIVSLVAKDINPGEVSDWVSCSAGTNEEVSEMKPYMVEIYSGTAKHIYNYDTGESMLEWGTKDKKAPVFYGWIKENSYANSDTFLICYTDRKNSLDFTRYVEALDDRDGKVKVEVDASRIDWSKEGVYKVIYIARDKAGNIASSWSKIRVYKPGKAEYAADTVLSRITSSSDSNEKKARKIYSYVRSNCLYVAWGSHSKWRTAALNGFINNYGDCYTHYAMARMLLSRAGIPNIEVSRCVYKAGNPHWWNLVYVHGGWYHLDATKRRTGAQFCLMTDAQLEGYQIEETYPFYFEKDNYPLRAETVISPNP